VGLRPYQAEDAEAVWAAIVEDTGALARWVPDIAAHRTLTQVREALTDLVVAEMRGKRVVLGVWDVDTHLYAGEVGLYALDQQNRSAELGYWLRASAQGRGRATEAVQLLVRYAAANLGIDRLEAHIGVENAASRQLAVRTGFQVVGRRPVVPRWDGEASEVLIFARHLNRDEGAA
jgi:ribosomal-protein-serine acetyltransferase